MPALQFDGRIRAVAVSNLKAMCARVSGTCHRFAVEKVGASVVTISYSNPDEYGNERPILLTLPIVRKAPKDDPDGATVLLDLGYSGRMTGPGCGTHGGEEWQCFYPLVECPQLWRSPHDGSWATEDEIKKSG